jgi:hypothetical protein
VAHFQLVMLDGEALGAVELSRPDWPPGSVIYRGANETDLRVVDHLPSGVPEEYAILVVEEVSYVSCPGGRFVSRRTPMSAGGGGGSR